MPKAHKNSDSNDALLQKVEELNKQLEAMDVENTRLQILLENAGVKEVEVSDAELICVRQLRMLKKSAEFTELTESQVRVFDILYRNLRILRGQEVPNQKGKKAAKQMSTKQLTEALQLIKS